MHFPNTERVVVVPLVTPLRGVTRLSTLRVDWPSRRLYLGNYLGAERLPIRDTAERCHEKSRRSVGPKEYIVSIEVDAP